MDPITSETLQDLMTHTDDVCISLYMPTVHAGKQTEQNAIRFKNLLYKAADTLDRMGIRKLERDAILAPAFSYLNDRIVWHMQDEGLAVFIAPGTFMSFRLPVPFDEELMVSERFYLKPVLPLFSNDGYYYLLTLSLDRVRLYRGSHFTVSEIEFNAPPGIAEALAFDEREPLRQTAARTANPRGDKNAMFYGHGLETEENKNRILRYFRKVNDAVHEIVRGKDIPMVLAGNDYLIPIYREANTYPKLMEKSIRKNPQSMSTDDLHRESWELVKPTFETAQQGELERYNRLAKSERASDKLDEILKAASINRIETLFVSKDFHVWGTVDKENMSVSLHDRAIDGDQELLDFAAIQTLLHDGTVFVLDSTQVPGSNPASAIFRY